MSSPQNKTRKRCPRGFRRDRKTGECIRKSIKKSKSPSKSSIHTPTKIIKVKVKVTRKVQAKAKAKLIVVNADVPIEAMATATATKDKPIDAIAKEEMTPIHEDAKSLLVINPIEKRSIDTSGYKMAAFDLDGTLIKTKSGKVHATNIDDWTFAFPNVTAAIQQLATRGYKIVVFTNQKGVGDGKKTSIDDFKRKIANIIAAIDVPITVYASLENDIYRKPMVGMYEYHVKCAPHITRDESFFVGDAYSDKESFSDSDYKFALNCGIDFHVASRYFAAIADGNEPAPYTEPIEMPLKKYYDNTIDDAELEAIRKYKYIVMVSPPATGKSTFCEEYLKTHTRLSRDDFGTPTLYKNAVKTAIAEDKHIVFDNTHATDKSRQEIIQLLPKTNTNTDTPILLLVRNIPKNVAMYLNKYRYATTRDPKKFLPELAIHTWFKRFEKPHATNQPPTHVIEIPLVFKKPLQQIYL